MSNSCSKLFLAASATLLAIGPLSLGKLAQKTGSPFADPSSSVETLDRLPYEYETFQGLLVLEHFLT